MKIANLSIFFDLSQPIDVQLNAFDAVQSELEKRGFTFNQPVRVNNAPSISKVADIGPNEKAWLAHSLRSRMNMKDKSLSREQQAASFLAEHGLTPPVPFTECDSLSQSVPNENTDGDIPSDNTDENEDDMDILTQH
jgi:hypothetical protein